MSSTAQTQIIFIRSLSLHSRAEGLVVKAHPRVPLFAIALCLLAAICLDCSSERLEDGGWSLASPPRGLRVNVAALLVDFIMSSSSPASPMPMVKTPCRLGIVLAEGLTGPCRQSPAVIDP